jgi:hypothetical protein
LLNQEEYLKQLEIREVYFIQNDTVIFSCTSNDNPNKPKTFRSDLVFGTWTSGIEWSQISWFGYQLLTDKKHRLERIEMMFSTKKKQDFKLNLVFNKSRITMAYGSIQ